MAAGLVAALASAAALPAEARFGRFAIPQGQLFFQSASRLTLGLVNLRPIVPGHVLLIPARPAPRVADLTDAELCDLWRSVAEVAARLEAHYGASAANLAVQDGPAAGQTVPHVHVHVLPRRGGDFASNDNVYDELEAYDGRREEGRVGLAVPPDEARVDRTADEMAAEARALRALWA